jgi:hypothetical protein
MALDFIILALPRSGSTWAATWLTGDATFCWHDPIWTTHYEDVPEAAARRAGGRLAGISDTGLWRWPEWIARQPARKLILQREPREVAASLARQGLPPLPRDAFTALDGIEGRRASWTDLFDSKRAAELWAWLTDGLPFDRERHEELVQCDVQPRLSMVKRDWRLNQRLGAEILARKDTARWQYL